MIDFLGPYLARWIHVLSAVTVLGGMIFASLAAIPALRGSASEASLGDAIAARFRPWFALGVLGLVLTGVYNYLRNVSLLGKALPPAYHMVFGMKFLLALHVFVVGYLALGHNKPKRARLIKGVVISGIFILGLSAGMRIMSQQALVHSALPR